MTGFDTPSAAFGPLGIFATVTGMYLGRREVYRPAKGNSVAASARAIVTAGEPGDDKVIAANSL